MSGLWGESQYLFSFVDVRACVCCGACRGGGGGCVEGARGGNRKKEK